MRTRHAGAAYTLPDHFYPGGTAYKEPTGTPGEYRIRIARLRVGMTIAHSRFLHHYCTAPFARTMPKGLRFRCFEDRRLG